MQFLELGLSNTICNNLEQIGFFTPTDIQKQAIPHILRLQDIIGLAQTGTGKTAAFLLPILNIQHATPQKHRKPSILILVPTRELAHQVISNLNKFDPFKILKPLMLIGGDSMTAQEKMLKKEHNILVVTPGRFLDFLDKKKLLLHGIKHVVIDEADRMLDMGFIPEVERILSSLPKIKQTLLFSATMAPDLKELIKKYMLLPKTIETSNLNKSKDSITQKIIMVEKKNKTLALVQVLKSQKDTNSVVFCNRKKDITDVEKSLNKAGFKASALHSGITQENRNKTLQSFKDREIEIIIASDVLARGVDIADLEMVINYDVPFHVEDYIHRIGRTGRANSKGVAYTLVSNSESKLLKNIEDTVKIEFIEEKISINTTHKSKQPTFAIMTDYQNTNNSVGFGAHTPAFMLKSALTNAGLFI